MGFQDVASTLLVRGIGVGMQQAYGDAFYFCRFETCDEAFNRVLVKGRQNVTPVIDPLGYGPAPASWDQRRVAVGVKIVLVETVFIADLQRVAMPLSHDQRGFGTPALNQRVGGERGAVRNECDIIGRNP